MDYKSGCLWAGADSDLQINILQKEWGYHGFIITDMAVSNGGTYMVFDDGIISGTSLYLRSGSKEALDAYSGNAAFCLKVRDSAKRIIYNVARFLAAMNGVSGAIGEVAPWYETLLNGLSIGTGILGGISLCLSIASLVLLRRKP